MAGVPVGGALAGLAGGGIASLYGWKVALLVIVLPAIATGLFLLIVRGKVRDTKARVKFKFFNLFNPLNLLSPFKVLKKIPGLPLITFVSIGYASIQGGVFTFLTTYLMTELKMPLVLVGGLYATMQVASFAGRISVGILADRFFTPRSVLIVLGLMGPLGIYVLTILSNNFSLFLLFPAMALIGVSIASWNGLFMTEVTNVAQDYDVSEATSASTFFTFITYMIAPLLFGYIALSYGYKYAFYSVGVCGLASVIALLIKAFREKI
jgi:MFS family permease